MTESSGDESISRRQETQMCLRHISEMLRHGGDVGGLERTHGGNRSDIIFRDDSLQTDVELRHIITQRGSIRCA